MPIHSSIRATVDADGNETAQALSGNVGGVISSADFETPGVTVQRGFGQHTVQSADQIHDTDIVAVDGMTMRADMARDMGLLGALFGDTPAAATPAAAEAEAAPKSDTGNPGYDAVVDGLNADIEAGIMDVSEATAYDAVVGGIALSGMTVEDAVATMDGLGDGSVDINDVDPETKALLSNAETQVHAAATKSAQAELGPEGFEWLSQAAQMPGVAAMVREFAVDRATGKANGITWTDFMHHVADQIGR